MSNLISETTRMKKLMGLIIEQGERYVACSKFEGSGNQVCKKLNNLKSWLWAKNGLGLRDDIESTLSDLYTEIPLEDMDKFMKGVDLIQQSGKYSDDEIERNIERIKNAKLIYVDGKWHFVNKLNTNYTDISELITEIIVRMGKIEETLDFLNRRPKEDDLKVFLLKSVKPNFKRFIDEYFKDKLEILEFTRNSRYNTEIGEKAEDRIEKLLESNGFKILYRGGNGDLVDMIFGADIIAERFDYGIVLVQVKSSGPNWESLGRYNVDFVGIGDGKIYDANKRKLIDITQYVGE
jgi:hypothetical protein